MTGAYGRIDWMPRYNIWRIIGYTKGRTPRSIKEIEVGRCEDKVDALEILRNWYLDNKWIVRYN